MFTYIYIHTWTYTCICVSIQTCIGSYWLLMPPFSPIYIITGTYLVTDSPHSVTHSPLFPLSLSLSTCTHTCSYTHTRLMMMMSVDNRLKSTIMRPWKFWSLGLWWVATLRMSWNLVRQFPTLHHLQWSLSPHPMSRTLSHIHIHTHTHTHTHPHAHTNPTHTHICLRIFRNLYSPSHWCHLLVQFSFSVSLSTRTHTHVHTPTLGSWWWWQ